MPELPLPSGPLSDEEVHRFLIVHNREMGGAHANKAFAMDSIECPWCGANTLFAKGKVVKDCGLMACMRRTEEDERAMQARSN